MEIFINTKLYYVNFKNVYKNATRKMDKIVISELPLFFKMKILQFYLFLHNTTVILNTVKCSKFYLEYIRIFYIENI